MGDILKNAKFGDKFLTRDGRVAILVHTPSLPEETIYMLAVDDKDMRSVCINVFVNGTAQKAYFSEKDDIVSRYNEPIDEKIIEDNAWNYIDTTFDQKGNFHSHHLMLAYKAGYRKAMEE